MSTVTDDIVGRGAREGGVLFRDWFDSLTRAAANQEQAAYVFVMGSLSEMLHAFGLHTVFPEINSLQTAVRRVSDEYLSLAEDHGFSPDVCGYVKADYALQVRGGEHAVRDRFAVAEPPVLGDGLESMAGCVTEVQHPSRARLPFVEAHHIRLDRARLADNRHEHRRLACEDGVHLAIDAFEQVAARRHAVLDDFVQAGAELAARQRLEERGIDDHHRGLVKCTDQILAERVIDAHLAAD